MADPISYLSFGASAAGSLLGAYGKQRQGRAAKEAGDYNASLLLDQADEELESAEVRLAQQRRYEKSLRGEQIASIAHSGGSLDDPTSQAILKDTAKQAAMDEWIIKYGANQTVRNLRLQAAQERYKGRVSETSGNMDAAATLLTGAGNLYSMGSKLGFW